MSAGAWLLIGTVLLITAALILLFRSKEGKVFTAAEIATIKNKIGNMYAKDQDACYKLMAELEKIAKDGKGAVSYDLDKIIQEVKGK